MFVVVAPGGVEPPEAGGAGLILVPVVKAAEAAGAGGAAAGENILVDASIVAGAGNAAAEHLRLLNLHHVHRGLLIFFLVHCILVLVACRREILQIYSNLTNLFLSTYNYHVIDHIILIND